MTWLLWVFAVLGFLLWAATAVLYYIFALSGHPHSIEKLASWGDSFGGISALFAAIGFFAVVWTLQLQQKQSRETALDQHRQRFESSFFELLKLLRETRDDVFFKLSREHSYELRGGDREGAKGIAAFKLAWLESEFWINKQSFGISKEEIAAIYEEKIHEGSEDILAPYFRLLYTIMKRTKNDALIGDEEKNSYGNILRCQLSSYELALAGLNGLSSVSADFGELIIHFHLLKYVPPGNRKIIMARYYPSETFESRD